MATFNYILGKKKEGGKYPIYLKICNGKSNTTLSLKTEVIKSEWNTKGQRVSIRRTDDHSTRDYKQRINDSLDHLTIRIKEVENILQQRGVLDEMSATDIKKALLEYNPNSKKIEGDGDFVSYWQMIAARKPKSEVKYRFALKVIINYQVAMYGSDTISFRNIDVDWVANCLSYIKETYNVRSSCKKGTIPKQENLKPHSIQSYTACLKTVLNCAVDAKRLSIEVMRGFRNFKANVEHTPPKVLTLEQIREFLNYPFKTMRQRMCRDLWIFSFCAMGMNLEDIYYLKCMSVKRTEETMKVSYIRHKTTKYIEFEILNCASHIYRLIEPYMPSRYNVWRFEGDTDYIFALKSNYNIYKTFANNTQKVIREIRKITKYDDEFTFYTARDSWATILSRDYQLGAEYVDAGLGHSSKSVAVNHYISVDRQTLYMAHADLLHRLFEE